MRKVLTLALAITAFAAIAGTAAASHSWGGYHWARTSPFTLKLSDNVNTAWDSYLTTTSEDWSTSAVLDTTIITGRADPKKCRPTSGRVEVCNASYGRNGWLGIASIWASGPHITQGTVKVNDSYFNAAPYNTPAWRNLVMCQEVGHTLGLDHQDEVFANPNLMTCMDYTNNPDTNQHPNLHDYTMLEMLYAHGDATTTIARAGTASAAVVGERREDWGERVRSGRNGVPSLYRKPLSNTETLFTFVYEVDGTHAD